MPRTAPGGPNVTTPTKKPGSGELTPGQKQRNKSLSGRRIVVEHVMGDIKEYKIMRGPFVGDAGTVQRDVQT